MRYIELVTQAPLIWGLFLAYMVITTGLAWLGHRKTGDMRSYSIGTGDLHPLVVGITLAASIASVATFVINPGFVYVHGVSALMHLGVAAGLGIIAGLLVMSFGFRRIGAETRALTLPHWISERFGSKALGVLFAGINLLSLSFVVLIVGGLSIVMQKTLGLSNLEALILIIVFVFGYVFLGGTYAHAYTNTLQGAIMIVVTLVILGSGLHLLGDIGPALRAADPQLTGAVNESSPLFGSSFSVFVCGFVIGFALVCQPHIMTKALYVKTSKQVAQYLIVTVVVAVLFTALLLVGLYARAMNLPPETFLDPATGAFRQDLVMTVYLAHTFEPGTLAVITVAILAAGMSTLDGILVALSSIAAHDIVLPLTPRRFLAAHTPESRSRFAHRMSRGILVLMAVAAFVIALSPPKLLGIFGQIGVYGIVAASTVPILIGILFPSAGWRTALAATLAGLAVHFGLYALGAWAAATGTDLVAASEALGPLGYLADRSAPLLGLRNPGVTATYALLASGALAASLLALTRLRATATTPAAEPA